MNGQQIIDQILREAEQQGYQSPATRYAQVVLTAMSAVDKATLYALLESCEQTGQRIELYSPLPYEQGYAEPMVRISSSNCQ